MRLSVIRQIFGVPWQIEASAVAQYYPFVLGLTRGAEFYPEPEPENCRPYAISTGSLKKVPYGYPSQDESRDQQPVSGSREPVIHVLPVRGVMLKHDMMCGPVGTRTLAARLGEADRDPAVLGHVLVFETPGGSHESVAELSDAIVGCHKPVIAWVDGQMCSAGMYAGSYCREIIASRDTDMVGSIGTMVVYEGRRSPSGENAEGTIHMRVYADEATQKNLEFESAINDLNVSLTRENILNPVNSRFVDVIRQNRPGVSPEHLHGRTYRAGEVVGALVDGIGSLAHALQRVVELSGEVGVKANADPSNTQDATLNLNHMKFTNIISVLGLQQESFILEADGRRTFTREEMESLEEALGLDEGDQLQAAVASLEQNLAAANARLQERDTRIQTLEQEVSRLRGAAAEQPAAALTTTDTGGARKAPGPVSQNYEQPLDAIHEVAREYLNQEL